MDKVMSLLREFNVTEYEVVTWLSAALEHKLSDDDCPERIELLVDALNELSYHV